MADPNEKFDHVIWARGRLGENASAHMVELVARLVGEQDWFLQDVSDYRIALELHDHAGTYWTLVLWRSPWDSNRFTSARLLRTETVMDGRSWASVDEMIARATSTSEEARRG